MVGLLAIAIFSLHGQQVQGTSTPLAFLVPSVTGDALRTAAPEVLRPILRDSVAPALAFASVNTSVAVALSNLPLPSPASSVRFVFDRRLGVYVPSAQSLGPILTERAETIGKGKLLFGVNFQRFQFDRLDDVDFRAFKVAIPFQIPTGVATPASVDALASTTVQLGLAISQTVAQMSYGLTHRMDISYAFPIVTSQMRFSTTDGEVRGFGRTLATIPRLSAEASSTGLGDGVARVKTKLIDRKGVALAIAMDVRLPIGDEFNYHGAGAYGVKPFLIASFALKSVSPHLNAGYQWNGKSFLASPTTSEKRQLPGQHFYAVGMDAAVSRRATLGFDIIDQIVINGQRTFRESGDTSEGRYLTVGFPNQTRHEVSGAAGIKAQLQPNLLLTGNLLLRLNQSGLRARVVPMVGLSYVF